MLKSFKTEIKLNESQTHKVNQSIGVCRFLYNSYIVKNKELYDSYKRGEIDKKYSFMSANEFDKWVNNHLKTQDEFKWIDLCGSKARKKSIVNAETAFKKFFKNESEFPSFKKKKSNDVHLYFPKNSKNDWLVDRHKIKIPTFKWGYLKEKGYIPTNIDVISGTVGIKAGRYYVSVLMEIPDDNDYSVCENPGIGIDLGIKDFAIVSNIENPFPNINKTDNVKKLEKKMIREQRKLSRKYESLKKRKNKNKEDATRQNIQKQTLKVQKLHQRLSNIRNDYINKTVNEIVKTKPSYITIEDLNVRGMMKNRHLAKAISKQGLNQFRVKLTEKCKLNGIELRVVDRWYPSSKICSECGAIKKDLNLSDRIYVCTECGCVLDRDKNASINLANAQIYKVA